ncbi:MAG TPA: single-stranded DNA-binding protein [Tepidisphaeraceae bacterium]|nr:single-stranded DNA-binding protein [Tepidisphaeraceae bacterium]
MPSFNRVTLIGNLTRDPQTRDLPSGTTLCEFGLATTRHYKTAGGEDREETCFIDCTAFGKQAEVLCHYVRKGRPLFVEGRLKYEQWDDKNGGGKRSKISVIVENFQFLGSASLPYAGRRDGNGRGEGSGNKSGSYADVKPREERPNDPEAAPAERADRTDRPQRQRTKLNAIVDKEKRFTDADIPF